MKYFFFLIISCALLQSCTQPIPTRWRGPDGDGVYNETGLMDTWPDDGPATAWMYNDLGEGFSSPAFANDKIYLSGMIDSIGYITILSMDGTLVRRFAYGKEFTDYFYGARSTPTVVGDLIYLQSGDGVIYCLNEPEEKVVWKKSIISDFGGKNLKFGVAESLVVDGDVVYASPGGPEYNVVALDRYNGEVVWSCEGKQTLSAYCTPLLIDHKGLKILTTMMADWVLGINAENGDLLWSYRYENKRPNFPNTPIYHEGDLYCFSGYENGGVMLKLSDDGKKVEERWKNDSLQSRMGGAVLLDGYLYGSGDSKRRWYCVDWKTGETVSSYKGLANGVTIAADNKLYLYTDRGEVVLMHPDPANLSIGGKTMMTEGQAQHWAHPVVRDKKLYVRHGDALVVYEI